MTRPARFPFLPRLGQRPSAFTLMELILTVAVLVILTGLLVQVSQRDWRREQVNAVLIELSGWLETVRRAALKGNSCTVTIAKDTYRIGDAKTLGQLQSQPPGQQDPIASCGSVQPFTLKGIAGNQAITVASSVSVTFTPAGTLFPPPASPIVISIGLADDSAPTRCLQLEGLLGAIDVGTPSSGEGGAQACTITARI